MDLAKPEGCTSAIIDFASPRRSASKNIGKEKQPVISTCGAPENDGDSIREITA
jgi:hypothetical protein